MSVATGQMRSGLKALKQKIIVLMVVVNCFSIGVAQAQDSCLQYKDLNKRYECWGSVVPPDKETMEAWRREGIEHARRWQVRTDVSRMTDDIDVYLSVESSQPISCSWGNEPAKLTIRCQENTTAVVLSAECQMTSGYGGYGSVTYRVDENSHRKRNFEASTDNRALGLWSYSRSRPLINELLDGETLIMRFTPFGDGSKEAVFNIAGLRTAIAPLRKSCGW